MSQWASQLSADPSNFNINGYIETDGFRRLLSQGVNRNGGLLALLGSQGVGKSDALLHLFYTAGVTIKRNVLFLNWRDPSEQIRDLLRHDYGLPTVDTNSPFTRMKEDFNSTYRLLLRTEIRKTRYVPIKLPKGRTLTDDLTSLDVDWAEKQLGQANCELTRASLVPSHSISKNRVDRSTGLCQNRQETHESTLGRDISTVEPVTQLSESAKHHHRNSKRNDSRPLLLRQNGKDRNTPVDGGGNAPIIHLHFQVHLPIRRSCVA